MKQIEPIFDEIRKTIERKSRVTWNRLNEALFVIGFQKVRDEVKNYKLLSVKIFYFLRGDFEFNSQTKNMIKYQDDVEILQTMPVR